MANKHVNFQNSVVVTSIGAIRALNGTPGDMASVASAEVHGAFWFDPTDTTSTDNGRTVIVAADGGRWKLIVTDADSVEYQPGSASAYRDGSVGAALAKGETDVAAVEASVDALETSVGTLTTSVSTLTTSVNTLDAAVFSSGGLEDAVNGLAAFPTTLAASSGSSLVGFIQAGTGAAAHSVQAELRGNITPEQFGAVGDNVANDTAACQAAIDYAILTGRTLELIGVYSVGPLTLNGTGHATPANAQYAGLSGLRGRGRFGATAFTARAGLYGSNQYVITGNNLAGVTYRDFGVDGNGVTTNGINLSWIGGVNGNPSATPSNQNIFQNIFVQGCTQTGINLDNVHDSKISGIWSRNSNSNENSISQQSGDGGSIVATDVWCTALYSASCQEGGITNFGLFGGVKFSGAGFNHFSFDKGQINVDPATGCAINSTAIGNATRGCVFNAVYFDPMTYCVRGRWHEGATFTGCHFGTWTAFADPANFTPAAGGGSPPTFYFRNCSFTGSTPVSVSGLYNVVVEGCRNSSGSIVNSSDTQTFTPTIAFGGGSTGVTYATQIGRYSIVGRRVTGHARVTLTSKGSSTGVVTIGGLPQTVIPVSNNVAASSVWMSSAASSVTCPQALALGNTTNLALYNFAAGVASSLTDTGFTSTTDVAVTFSYDF